MRKRKSFFRENLSLKLVSLLLAILLELYFYSPDNSLRVSLPLSIEIRGIPTSFTVVRPQGGDQGILAHMELRGPRPLMEQVRRANHKVYIDYPPDSPMIFTAAVDRRQLWLPAGVEVVDVSPSAITVELERIMTKAVQVVVEKYGQVPDGYRLDGISISPEKVTISGPEREVKHLQAVGTDRIDLTSITAPQRIQLPLLRPGSITIQGDGLAHVDLQVSAIPAEKAFEGVTVKIIGPAGFAATVEPSRVKLLLKGPKPVLEKLRVQDIELVADAQALSEGKHTMKPALKPTGTLQEGITVLSTEPASVGVTVVRPSS